MEATVVFDTFVGVAAAATVTAVAVADADAIRPMLALMKPVNHHQSIYLKDRQIK